MRNTFIQTVLFASTLIASVWVSPHTSQAQTSQTPENTNIDINWQVSCSNRSDPEALSCVMTQGVFRNEPNQTRQRILTATIFKNSEAGYIMRLALPHGLDLLKRVEIKVDNNKTVQHPVTTADANGAYTQVPLNETMLSAIKVGGIITVKFYALNGNAVNVELSLVGFPDHSS